MTDQRVLKTKTVTITPDQLDQDIVLTGGIFGLTTLVANYDQEDESVYLDYFARDPEGEALEQTSLALGEPVLVWLTNEQDEIIQLVFELETPIGGPYPKPKPLPDPKPKPLPDPKPLPIETPKPKVIIYKTKGNLPKTGEETPGISLLTTMGQSFLLATFVSWYYRKKQKGYLK